MNSSVLMWMLCTTLVHSNSWTPNECRTERTPSRRVISILSTQTRTDIALQVKQLLFESFPGPLTRMTRQRPSAQSHRLSSFNYEIRIIRCISHGYPQVHQLTAPNRRTKNHYVIPAPNCHGALLPRPLYTYVWDSMYVRWISAGSQELKIYMYRTK